MGVGLQALEETCNVIWGWYISLRTNLLSCCVNMCLCLQQYGREFLLQMIISEREIEREGEERVGRGRGIRGEREGEMRYKGCYCQCTLLWLRYTSKGFVSRGAMGDCSTLSQSLGFRKTSTSIHSSYLLFHSSLSSTSSPRMLR